MPARETSIAAMRENNRTGQTETIRSQIYKAVSFSRNPVTRNQIASMTGLPINTVCGRVNELLKVGMLIELPAITTETGRKAYPVSADVRTTKCKNCHKTLHVYRPDPVPVLGYLCSDECARENEDHYR